MSPTWNGATPPIPAPLGPRDWAIVILRGLPLFLLIVTGLPLLLALRGFERLFGFARGPISGHVPVFVCRAAMRVLGIHLTRDGAIMRARGALVANHASWLDILVLNAQGPVVFVAKSEVADWPGIGWLARATGTVFVTRDPREAPAQAALLRARLAQGQRLLFFPEGTSSDGMRVLPFKSTLFAALHSGDDSADLHVQPVSVLYHAPPAADPRFFAWWGEMAFGPHFIEVLARGAGGAAHVLFHPAQAVAEYPDRKTLARACETDVRAGHDERPAPVTA